MTKSQRSGKSNSWQAEMLERSSIVYKRMGTYCIKRIVIKHGMHWHYTGILIHYIDGRARAKRGGKAEWPRGIQIGCAEIFCRCIDTL